MSWSVAVERTVSGLGYDLVDLERSAGGLLRVTIDRIPGRQYGAPSVAPVAEGDAAAEVPEQAPSGHITVDDCEIVTRQLQRVLEVENVDYARLEVSSPGLDRPLKREHDFRRFVGHPVALTLRLPLGGRKRFQGTLRSLDDAAAGSWRLELDPGQVPGAADDVLQTLDFSLAELREAHLVPQLDFKKGRRSGEPTRRPQAGDKRKTETAKQ